MSGIRPMLASAGPMPTADGWSYEIKWDGVRAIAYVADGGIRMESRNLNDFTPRYPEVCRPEALPHSLRSRRAVLDGEIVGFDADGKVSFGALQQRMHLASRSAVASRQRAHPVAFMAFDVLWLDGVDVTGRPFEERRQLLETLEIVGDRWQTPPSLGPAAADGEALRSASVAQGLEGIVAKRHGSAYEPGRRTRNWLKIKNRAQQELVIGGWLPGEGNRSGTLGALLVGHHARDGLHYAGRVGTGFTFKLLADLLARLSALEQAEPAFVNPPPLRAARWVEPRLVAEVGFTEWTSGGTLRHPVFLGLRDDVDPAQVVREPTMGEN